MVGYATTGGFVSAACYSGLGISAAVVVVVGVRRHRPARTRAWCTLAAGLGCWAAGDLWWYQDDLIRHVTTPFPTGADGLYLLGYVVLAVGVRALARDDETGETVLDAATLTLGVGLLAWVPLVRPLVDGSHPLTTAIALGYPAGDLLLAAMAVRLFLTGLQRRPALAALAVAIGGCLVTDFAYAELVHAGTVDSTTILDLGWLASYALVGLAALHPSMAGVGGAESAPRPAGWIRLALLWTVACEAPVVATWAVLAHEPVAAAASGLTAVLVMWRMARGARTAAAAARIDRLTGLPNRTELEVRLDAAVDAPGGVGVLFLDLDRFKQVNDVLGHRTGDRLLVAVGGRLRGIVPARSLVGRFGGDEFVVVCPGVDEGELAALATRIRDVFTDPFAVSSDPLHVSVSIGAARSGPGDTGEDVLANADAAMYAAKAAGGGRHHVFAAPMRAVNERRRVIERDLRQAIAGGEVAVHYQPIVSLASEAVVGVEALARWDHPSFGPVSPCEFVPVAEDCGLVGSLGRLVLEQASRAALHLPDGVSVAVNLSGRQLDDDAVVDDVREALATSGLAPQRLVLEVTESVFVDGTGPAAGRIADLVALGVRFAIDDFGTGFSSMSRLKDLPVSTLKVDRSFVAGICDDAKDRTLVAGIAYLAHGLGLDVVAEGVESEEQAAVLRSLGCDNGQGYRWSPARPLADVVRRSSPVLPRN
jgi:diguanylate cyclase (GGDEF)-like protein